jgi:hypothetical protein
MKVSTGSEDEKGPAQGRVPLVDFEWDLLTGDVGEDDQVDIASRWGTRLHSTRA